MGTPKLMGTLYGVPPIFFDPKPDSSNVSPPPLLGPPRQSVGGCRPPPPLPIRRRGLLLFRQLTPPVPPVPPGVVLWSAGIPLSRAVMVGDSARDREAARAAGCPAFILVTSSPHGEVSAWPPCQQLCLRGWHKALCDAQDFPFPIRLRAVF